jgi:hypothetical protein
MLYKCVFIFIIEDFFKKNKDVYLFKRSLPNLVYKTYCYCPTTEDVLNTIFLQPLSLLRYLASNVTTH